MSENENLILGKYRIIEELGRGGMGVVYKAENVVIEKIVAIKKMFRDPRLTDAEYQEQAYRFLQEAKNVAKLDAHPNIVTIYDAGEENGEYFIVMEYLEGKDLSQHMEEGTVFDLKDCIKIAIAAASGLGYAHEKGIVHRDVKPSNIMLLSSGEIKVMDFGIAKALDSAAKTRTGMAFGTLGYMSPDLKFKDIDGRADIFSLMVVFYQLVTRQLPFPGDSFYEYYDNLNSPEFDPLPPSQLNQNIPMSLEMIIKKGLIKDRKFRYQNCNELIQDLSKAFNELETGEPTNIIPRGTQPPPQPPTIQPIEPKGVDTGEIPADKEGKQRKGSMDGGTSISPGEKSTSTIDKERKKRILLYSSAVVIVALLIFLSLSGTFFRSNGNVQITPPGNEVSQEEKDQGKEGKSNGSGKITNSSPSSAPGKSISPGVASVLNKSLSPSPQSSPVEVSLVKVPKNLKADRLEYAKKGEEKKIIERNDFDSSSFKEWQPGKYSIIFIKKSHNPIPRSIELQPGKQHTIEGPTSDEWKKEKKTILTLESSVSCKVKIFRKSDGKLMKPPSPLKLNAGVKSEIPLKPGVYKIVASQDGYDNLPIKVTLNKGSYIPKQINLSRSYTPPPPTRKTIIQPYRQPYSRPKHTEPVIRPGGVE